MSYRYKRGDKFIVEVVDLINSCFGKKYLLKGMSKYINEDELDNLERVDAGYEDKALDKMLDKLYQCGLDDAWEAMRKIIYYPRDGGLTLEALNELFKSDLPTDILHNYSASESIRKIREYEKEIRVGDECVYKSEYSTNPPLIITRIYNEGNNRFFDGIFADGSLIEDGTLELIKKTGRYFPQIADALGQMKQTLTDEDLKKIWSCWNFPV